MRAMMFEATVFPPKKTTSTAGAARWRPDFARIRGIVPLAIADQIEEAIRAGVLSIGERLPTQRAIAADLGFHLNTINAAFREAARRGLIESRTRRGTIVSTTPHAA
jgi:DNA-binding FadR family transcriptional regulator